MLVQLNWHKDDLRADEKSTLPAQQPLEESSFRRKLSKKEKRNAKKENMLRKMKSSEQGGEEDNKNNGTVVEKLYTEFPETSFIRRLVIRKNKFSFKKWFYLGAILPPQT